MSVTASNSLTYVSGNASTNTAVVRYVVTATTTGSSHSEYTKTTTVNVDGQVSYGYTTLPYTSTVTAFSGEFTVGNASGRTITATYSLPTGLSSGTLTGSATVTIPVLIQTPTLTCSATPGLDTIGASLTVTNNGGASIVSQGIRLYSDSGCTTQVKAFTGTSGTFTGLTPNTTYYARAYANNGTFTGYSTVQTVTTYNKATISTASNFNHGDTLTVTYSNPSSSALAIGIYKGDTPIASDRTCTGTSYTFTFTDTELDDLYKEYGNGNTQTVRVILKTANTYTDYKDLTVTLTGNQKTIRDKVSGEWKRGIAYIKVSGEWKKGVIWTKVNGTWKRGI